VQKVDTNVEDRIKKYSILDQTLVMLDSVTDYIYCFSHGLFCSALLLLLLLVVLVVVICFNRKYVLPVMSVTKEFHATLS
jgi:hypothetical protein